MPMEPMEGMGRFFVLFIEKLYIPQAIRFNADLLFFQAVNEPNPTVVITTITTTYSKENILQHSMCLITNLKKSNARNVVEYYFLSTKSYIF